MTAWALLAPGPSASAGLVGHVQEARIPLGVVGCAYQLASRADFIAASDSAWWRQYPEAMQFPKRYTMHVVRGVETVRVPAIGTVCNSGVLALECAKLQGATHILLLGFDMHGSHFFGPYTNGLSNTNDSKRKVHLNQYDRWRRANSNIEVLNCTEGSALQCFPMMRLEDAIGRHVQVAYGGVQGEVHGRACEHPAQDGGEALQSAA